MRGENSGDGCSDPVGDFVLMGDEMASFFKFLEDLYCLAAKRLVDMMKLLCGVELCRSR